MEGNLDALGKFVLHKLADSALRSKNLKTIQAMTEYAYLGNQIGLCKILGRFHCYIDTRDRKICSHLLTKGVWEIQNTECIVKYIKPNMTVVDVGANFGYFTLLMAGLIGNNGGHVYSIEANPMLSELVKDSLEVNAMLAKVTLINGAIYSHAIEDIGFTFGNNKTFNGRLSQFKNKPHQMREKEQAIRVNGNTFDHLVPQD